METQKVPNNGTRLTTLQNRILAQHSTVYMILMPGYMEI